MRIVIDLQGAQTDSRFRGVGRYCLALAQALLRNRGSHEVFIAVSGLFPDTVESVRATFDGLIDQDRIRVWQAVGPSFGPDLEDSWRRQAAELMREEFLASLRPDIVHVGNFFEGLTDNTTFSIGKRRQFPTAVTFYDAIPLIHPNTYLKPNPKFESFYRSRLEQLSRADLLLAISESARQEAIDYANVPPERVISISSACDPMFSPALVPEETRAALCHKLRLRSESFIMYSGGADERKNHLSLIEAFAQLPQDLRKRYPLLFVGMMPVDRSERFLKHAHAQGLGEGEFVLGGHVTDADLVNLYRLCTLFVFPSKHEGFGLPVLEAMSCGAPTICSNTTSLPEVMDRPESMFDPLDVQSLSRLLGELLGSPEKRDALARYGLARSKQFSWDRCARTALNAFEQLHRERTKEVQPPACSLLDELLDSVETASKGAQPPRDDELLELAVALSSNNRWHLDKSDGPRRLLIDLSEIVANDGKSGVQRVAHGILSSLVQSPPPGYSVELVYSPREAAHFRHARAYGRQRYPGLTTHEGEDEVVAVQPGDIFFGLDLHHAAMCRPEFFGRLRQLGVPTVFLVHDLLPLHLPACFAKGMDDYHARWLKFICQSDGIVCVSQDVAKDLVAWLDANAVERQRPLYIGWSLHGSDASSVWSAPLEVQQGELLTQLQDRAVFLSVATLEPRKGHAQLLGAFDLLWAHDLDISLVLVGREGWGVEGLIRDIRHHPEFGRRLIWLAGIGDEFLEQLYRISSCLIAPSKGEGFGLPLIEAGSRNLPVLARDLPVFREVAGDHAMYFRGTAPKDLASAILGWLDAKERGTVPAPSGISQLSWAESTKNLLRLVLDAQWQRRWQRQRTLFLDVSELVRTDARTGIQRVVRALARNLLRSAPLGWSICLVWFDGERYRHALRLQTAMCHGIDSLAAEPVAEFREGDVYLALDLSPTLQPRMEATQRQMRKSGVAVWIVVYDLLPLRRPEWWGEAAHVDAFKQWIASATNVASGFLCISEATADDVRHYLQETGRERVDSPLVRHFHIGADIEDSEPSLGLPPDAKDVLAALRRHPTFLMVGTLEPRKGHAQALAAFERLWAQGHEVNLAVVGKKGWLVDKLVERILKHPRLGRELHLFQGVSDEYLERIYGSATCLLAPSEGEGFGLPLVEAAKKRMPIVARDLPVFREVAGQHAYYFSGLGAEDLASAIAEWLELSRQGREPRTDHMPWLSWRESAQQLIQALGLTSQAAGTVNPDPRIPS